jgi:hypothetical protein
VEQYERLAPKAEINVPPANETSSAIEEPEGGNAFGWGEATRTVVVGLAAVAVRLHLWEPFPSISLGILGVLIGGWPIFKEAAENLAARRMTMELSMSIAILAAAAISEFFTALIITLFVLAAEVLENMTVSRDAGRSETCWNFFRGRLPSVAPAAFTRPQLSSCVPAIRCWLTPGRWCR